MASAPSTRDQIHQRMRHEQIVSVFRSQPTHLFAISEINHFLDESQKIDTATLLKHLRQMIIHGQIRVIQSEEGRNQYRFVPDEEQHKFAGLSEEHHRIYNLIEKSGNTGIWRRELKRKGQMEEKQITSVIKELENKQLIKNVSSIHDKTIKVYMVYNMTPSADVTGGVWYQDGVFNHSIVEMLIPYVTQVVLSKERKGISTSDLKELIRTSRIGNVALTDTEAQQVIEATVNSGRITRIGNILLPGLGPMPVCPISRIPCKGCPVASQCSAGGRVNPIECPYLSKLAELF